MKLSILAIIHGHCHYLSVTVSISPLGHPPFARKLHEAVQCQLVSTSVPRPTNSDLVATSYKLGVSTQTQEKRIVDCFGSDLGPELTSSSLTQKSSLICLSTFFSFPCNGMNESLSSNIRALFFFILVSIQQNLMGLQ